MTNQKGQGKQRFIYPQGRLSDKQGAAVGNWRHGGLTKKD